VSAYRGAGERGDGRAPEIEVFRLASNARRALFAVAAVVLVVSLAGGAFALARRDPRLASVPACGILCAAALAFFGRGRFALLVVSHVPAERTLHVLLDARERSARRITFDAPPEVRLEEVRQPRSSPDAPDAPPAFRVRIDGAPASATIEQPFPRESARRLQRALRDAIATWPTS
jgi:hypothetical protein